MVWTQAMRGERQKELDEAVWSTSWSAKRRAEVAEWEHKRVILTNACVQAKSAAVRMMRWSWGSAGGAASVPRLSELSFKKALGGIVDLVYEMDDEVSGLYQEHELYRRRQNAQGEWQMWYNDSFNVHDARWAKTCLRIQRGLLAVQFYVDLWRAVCPGVHGEWDLYDDGTAELGRLVFAGAGETAEAEADAAGAASALAGMDLKGTDQQCRMQTLLGELAGMGAAG
jgi:hypothetical protein